MARRGCRAVGPHYASRSRQPSWPSPAARAGRHGSRTHRTALRRASRQSDAVEQRSQTVQPQRYVTLGRDYATSTLRGAAGALGSARLLPCAPRTSACGAACAAQADTWGPSSSRRPCACACACACACRIVQDRLADRSAPALPPSPATGLRDSGNAGWLSAEPVLPAPPHGEWTGVDEPAGTPGG